MKMRNVFVGATATAALALGGGAAFADSTPDCPDVGKQVRIGDSGDPWSLDRNGDGLGCESYAKNGTVTMESLLAPPSASPSAAVKPSPAASAAVKPSPAASGTELAKTGWGVGEHPVRWMGATGGLLVAGAAVVFVARRKVTDDES